MNMTDNWIDTSELPKNAQRNPEIKYMAGFSMLTSRQIDGNMSME